MIRIAALGNCQADVIAASFRRLLPEAEVDVFALWKLSDDDIARAPHQLTTYDYVFSQPMLPVGRFAALRSDELARSAKAFQFVPALTFTGFHPDIVAIEGIRSPIGNYHSAIAIAAFLSGLPEPRAVALFNTFVYAALGYFDHYAMSRQYVIERANGLGYDLNEPFQKWEEMSPFMYSFNHPKGFVLASVARLGLTRAGLLPGGTADPELDDDPYQGGARWPIYPEIAERLGVGAGDLSFEYPFGKVRLGLEEFVVRSYEIYRRFPADVLARSVERQSETLRSMVVR